MSMTTIVCLTVGACFAMACSVAFKFIETWKETTLIKSKPSLFERMLTGRMHDEEEDE